MNRGLEGKKYMSNNNVTKFQHIVAGLEPAKKQALYQKMKSLPENERNEMIDKVVAVYETRKLKIEQPVPAGIILPPNNYGRSAPHRSERKTMWVDDRPERNVRNVPSNRITHPIKAETAKNNALKPVPVSASAATVTAVRRPGAKPPIQRKAAYTPALNARNGAHTVSSARTEAAGKEQRSAAAKKVLKIALITAGRASLVLVLTLILICCGFYSFLGIMMKGPSPHLRDQFVSSVMESSMGGIFAKMILSDEEINEILNRNKTQEFSEYTDTNLVKIGEKTADADATAVNAFDPDGDGVEIHEISGPMYRGVMMVVLDPSRVKVSTLEEYNHKGAGYTLKEHIEKSGAIGGINGGKYEDEGGLGIGGWPEGIVIADGKLRMGYPNGTYDVYGFTKDNVLVVGRMTGKQALNIGVRDAVSFGPTLIVNGKAAKYSGNSGGLNPRTAIGQREDGAVLLLVIEGRKTASMGATMADLIDVMKEYGAVNAANLDGGMSSAMWYNNEELVSSSSIRQSRKMPTAFVVMPKQKVTKAEAPKEK